MADSRRVPRFIKGFAQHGVELEDGQGGNAKGTCPFCGKEKKITVSEKTGVWRCFSCNRKGNFDQFLGERSELYREAFVGSVVRTLARHRGLKPSTFKAWGVGWSPAKEFYSIPMQGNPTETVTDIHRYFLRLKKGPGTSGGRHSFIAPLKMTGLGPLYICEGEWDGMAMWECLRVEKEKGDVLALPGAGNMPKHLTDILKGRHVVVLSDNDEPGRRGAYRLLGLIEGSARGVKWLKWPDGLPEGYDFRDFYLENRQNNRKTMPRLRKLYVDEPPECEQTPDTPGKASVKAVSARMKAGVEEKAELVGKRQTITRDDAAKRYRKWLHLRNDEPLDVIFGVMMANRLDGDPLWMFIVAPSGGAKSELLMSLSESPLTIARTSITQHTLISGGAALGGGDPSLLPDLNEKVLIVKDFTTIMSLNTTARDEIFGQLRDAYDVKTNWQFGNGMVREYESKFGILAGVTSAVEQFNSNSVLGERFIRYRMTERGNITAGTNAIRQALKNIAKENRMRSDLQDVAKKVLTREVSPEHIPEYGDETIDRVLKLAQWVATLRGVVNRDKYRAHLVLSKPSPEIGTRLAKQFMKLAIGIGIYKQEKVLSEGTYRTITRVATHTAPDRVEEIVKQMFVEDPEVWKSTKEVAGLTNFTDETTRFVLEDLQMLRVVDKEPGRTGRWRLTPPMLRMMRSLGLYDVQLEWKKAKRKRKRRT